MTSTVRLSSVCMFVLCTQGGVILANSSVTGYPPSFLSALGETPSYDCMKPYKMKVPRALFSCFIFVLYFRRVHSVLYFFLENIALEILLHIRYKQQLDGESMYTT